MYGSNSLTNITQKLIKLIVIIANVTRIQNRISLISKTLILN